MLEAPNGLNVTIQTAKDHIIYLRQAYYIIFLGVCIGAIFIPKWRMNTMSIQEKSYNTKKSGKITKYFASVWDAKQKKSHTGPLRTSRKGAVKDEAELIQKLQEGIKIEAKNKKMSLGQPWQSMWCCRIRSYRIRRTYIA